MIKKNADPPADRNLVSLSVVRRSTEADGVRARADSRSHRRGPEADHRL